MNQPCQLLNFVLFNTVQKRGGSYSQYRHNTEKETLLSIYIVFLLHSNTRSCTLVDMFYHLGLCISYDHMLTFSTNLGNSICAQIEEDGIVCPASLRFRILSTFTVDNIDHNPSSRTATDSWHGTAISATQHIDNAHDSSVKWSDTGHFLESQGKIFLSFSCTLFLHIFDI